MPTPIKYYNAEIKEAYKKIEAIAEEQLVDMLPCDLKEDFIPYFKPSEDSVALIKAADKISALIKCIEEIKMGNMEFNQAEKSTKASIEKLDCEEAKIFCKEFLKSFYLTLDEQRNTDS